MPSAYFPFAGKRKHRNADSRFCRDERSLLRFSCSERISCTNLSIKPLSFRRVITASNLRHKPGKGDIVIFAIYLAKFGTTVLCADVIIQAGKEIEVYFFSVTAHPLRFPAFGREVLCHVLFHAHPVHCKNERHPSKLPVLQK